MMSSKALNVYQQPLQVCSPIPGFYRDGICRVGVDDVGVHAVCAVMTDSFLYFSAEKGNDLITPQPSFNFPGLKAGDSWCLCLNRWLEAEKVSLAPLLKLEACHQRLLDHFDLATLEKNFRYDSGAHES